MQRSTTCPFPILTAAAIVAASCLASPTLADEPTTRVAALNGDEPGDLQIGEVLEVTGSRSVLSIARGGRVLFDGFASGFSGRREGYFTAVGSTVSALALFGEPIPITGVSAFRFPGTYTYQRFEAARMTPERDTVVEVDVTNGTIQERALITSIGGVTQISSIETLAAIPPLCLLGRQGNGLYAHDFALAGDHLGFFGSFDQGACGNIDEAVFRRQGGQNALQLAREATPPPGQPGREFNQVFRGMTQHANGTSMFHGRYRDGGNNLVSVLLVAAPGQTLTSLASSRIPLAGTQLQKIDFGIWTFGEVATGETVPRIGYTVFAGADPDAQATHVAVIDSLQGSAPVLQTGDQSGGFTLTATAFDGLPLALADPRVVVTVGKTSGASMAGGEGQAIWRVDGSQGPPTKNVVLYEGGPVTGQLSETRLIERIRTVNVNEHGRIAAEIEFTGGREAILLEDATQPLDTPVFEVAFEQLSTQTVTRNPPVSELSVRVVGILSSFPRQPEFTGPGRDGKQTRFNAAGEFVFRAAVEETGTSNQRDGVFVTSLTPPKTTDDCEVEVRQRGKHLTITGKKGSCALTVDVTGVGNVVVAGGPSTLINGVNAPFSGTVAGNVIVNFATEDHSVTFRGTGPVSADSLPGNLIYRGGTGSDTLVVDTLEIARSLIVDLGAGSSGQVRMNATTIHGKARLRSDEDETAYDFDDCSANRNVSVLPGGGNTTFNAIDTHLGPTRIRTSRGRDSIEMERGIVEGSLRVDLGTGAGDGVELTDTTIDGSVALSHQRGSATKWTLRGVSVTNGSITARAGLGGADVLLDDCDVAKQLVLRTNGSPVVQENVVELFDISTGRSAVLRGKGDHHVSIGSNGILVNNQFATGLAINLRGGANDDVSVRDTNIGSRGLLQIASAATTMFRCALFGVQVRNGALSVRGANGDDNVDVQFATVAGRLQVSGGDGDDVVSVSDCQVEQLRLFGGAGTDTLISGAAANTVSGKVVETDFE